MGYEDVPKIEKEKRDKFLLEEISYLEDQSPQFDLILENNKCTEAHMGSVSKVTKEAVLMSGWQVPCHSILIRAENGETQLLHVHPSRRNSVSFLTGEQQEAMNEFKMKRASAISVHSERGCFSLPDKVELEDNSILLERGIDVGTRDRWRLLYNPGNNEIWIDIQDKKVLKKYKGFENFSDEFAKKGQNS